MKLNKKKIYFCIFYISSVLLLISLLRLSRFGDMRLFSAAYPYKPFEMTLNFAVIGAVILFLRRMRDLNDVKFGKRHKLFALTPLVLTLISAVFIINVYIQSLQGASLVLEKGLAAFACDLLICAVGCELIIHKLHLHIAGRIMVLACLTAYDLLLTEKSGIHFFAAAVVALILGFFEIELHIYTGSALLCGAYHFSFSIFESIVEMSEERFVTFKVIIYTVYALWIAAMVAIGTYFLIKNRKREKQKKIQVDDIRQD